MFSLPVFPFKSDSIGSLSVGDNKRTYVALQLGRAFTGQGDGGYSAHRISRCCIFKCLHISRCGARNNRRHVARNASCRCAHGWNSVGSVPRDKSLGTVLTQALLVPLPAVVTTRILS